MTTRVFKEEIVGGITNFAFAYENKEMSAWCCCSNTLVPQSDDIIVYLGIYVTVFNSLSFFFY